jgi:hypothetical protein
MSQITEQVERGVKFWHVQNKRIEIFEYVCNERERQDEKFGVQNHEPADWCMILGEEIGEVNKAALEAKFEGKDISEYRKELIQSAAVIFSMIECLDRNSA